MLKNEDAIPAITQAAPHQVIAQGIDAIRLPTSLHSKKHFSTTEYLTSQLRLVVSSDPHRQALEHYIHDRFAHEYRAEINRFMPYLIMLHNSEQTLGALGFRPAQRTQLFLESYIDNPIEDTLAAITHLAVSREKIAEVGNLAATGPGASVPLIGAIACFLDQAGFDWAVVCATPTVQNIFSKLQIPLIRLADADICALPDDQKALWGNYYASHPIVMAVHVRTAHRCIQSSLFGRRLLDNLDISLKTMLNQWRLSHA